MIWAVPPWHKEHLKKRHLRPGRDQQVPDHPHECGDFFQEVPASHRPQRLRASSPEKRYGEKTETAGGDHGDHGGC